MNNVTFNPNFEYLYKNFDYFNFKGFYRKNSIVYKDGHMINNNLPENEQKIKEWKKTQLTIFKEWTEKSKWQTSQYRLNWFNKTVSYLSKYGTVVLVRMPFDNEFLQIENNFWPNFNESIEEIVYNQDLLYLDFSKCSKWETIDGHHLNEKSARLFSRKIANEILKHDEGQKKSKYKRIQLCK